MWKSVALAIAISGCTPTPTPIVVELPVYHPSMPVPYEVCNVAWEVFEVENRAKVALSYDDNLTMAICLGDIEKYISQLLNVTCQYRQELKDAVCLHKKESNVK